MIINKGLWILVSVDGISGAFGQTHKGRAFLTIVGPEREVGNPGSAYTPFGKPPSDDDASPFANLYRKLGALVKEQKLDGPFAEENHPAVFRRFLWFAGESPADLLEMLAQADVTVRVREIPHNGDDAEVAEAIAIFKRWMDDDTIVKPNPKIEEDRRRKADAENCKKRYEEAKCQEDWLRKYFFLPLLALVILVTTYCIATSHWWSAIATIVSLIVIYAVIVFWPIRRT